MDKQQLFSWIGYLKSELYKPALRPYVTALLGVLEYAEEQLQQPPGHPEALRKALHKGKADTGPPQKRYEMPPGRNANAIRQARWRAAHRSKPAE